MDDKLKELAEHRRGGAARRGARRPRSRHGELMLPRRARRDRCACCTFLRDDPKCRFTVLCDICGVDYPDRPAALRGRL